MCLTFPLNASTHTPLQYSTCSLPRVFGELSCQTAQQQQQQQRRKKREFSACLLMMMAPFFASIDETLFCVRRPSISSIVPQHDGGFIPPRTTTNSSTQLSLTHTMGVCIGKEHPPGGGLNSDLDPDGRFIPQSSSTMNNNDTPTNGKQVVVELRTPVIFVLGGPGSGKITHCDRVVQERPGLAHVNMTDLIQQHVVGNAGLDDFSSLPAPNLVEVLQMEMKMAAVNAKAFLVSGYPRSMRDVVEYQRKLSRIDAVILLNWHLRILEKQIEYGSHLGETVLQLARMELKNYSKHVLAVAEYFDQMKKLVVVDGERQPSDVYQDFLDQVDKVVAKGTQQQQTDVATTKLPIAAKTRNAADNEAESVPSISAIWVVGGPGSNKSLLSSSSVRLHHSGEWEWLSVGDLLRGHAPQMDRYVRKGDLAPDKFVMEILTDAVRKSRKRKFVIDAFPRTTTQADLFREKFGVKPPCILVDCSEPELSKSLSVRPSRDDPGVIKKRLDLYRTVTLPTLKILDDQKRLHIIDGDVADKGRIVEEFNDTLGSLIDSFDAKKLSQLKLPQQPNDARKPSTDTINNMYNELLDQDGHGNQT